MTHLFNFCPFMALFLPNILYLMCIPISKSGFGRMNTRLTINIIDIHRHTIGKCIRDIYLALWGGFGYCPP